MRLSCVLSLLLAFATSALASDGVLEINQTCAVETGCFPGDAAGFPVTIGTRGSYRLTSNLLLGDPNTDAIQVAANEVQVDLNGFTIDGVTACAGAPPNCSNTGTGRGIADASGQRLIKVSNGFINGMGSGCVDLTFQAHVEDLVVSSCGGDGITVDGIGIVRRNSVRLVAGIGIRTGTRMLVEKNVVVFAGDFGLSIGAQGAYGGNVLSDNAGGAANPQISASTTAFQIAPNVCAGSLCP